MSNEKPILFKDDMIRAILEGRKCQTRRIVKGAPTTEVGHRLMCSENGWNWQADQEGVYPSLHREIDDPIQCPYGKPGDRLWVRENFLQLMHGQVTAGDVKYCASIDPRSTGTPKNTGYWWRKRPSIHMPRWASRITLEITGVRVERLQDISEADAKAEGARFELAEVDSVRLGAEASHKSGFQNLWQSINGPDSWHANPWVWVIEFRRIDQENKQ